MGAENTEENANEYRYYTYRRVRAGVGFVKGAPPRDKQENTFVVPDVYILQYHMA